MLLNSKNIGFTRKIKGDEIESWIESYKEVSDIDFKEWIEQEQAWINEFDIPAKNLFLFDQKGKYPGKLCFINEDKNSILFAAPAIKSCKEVKFIASSLFQFAIEETKNRDVEQLQCFIDDCNNYHDLLIEALLELGFKEKIHKFLYSKTLDKHLEIKHIEHLKIVNGNKIGKEEIIKLFLKINNSSSDSIDKDISMDGQENYGYIKDHIPQDCQLLVYKNRLIGMSVVMYKSKQPKDNFGKMEMTGILNEFRGRGFGDILFKESLNALYRKGARKYIGSTEISNKSMIRIFEGNGCEKIANRIEFVYKIKN